LATDPAGSAEAGETRQGERQTPDLSRFLIRSPSQIGQVLRALSEHAEIVTAYFNRGREFLLTAIVDVDVQGGTVLLDQGSDEALNQKLLASDRVVLVSAHDKVKVQFSVKQVRAAMHEGRPALAIDLPPEMLKLQRREFFRIRTSVQAPVRCRLQVSEGQVLDLSALDISIGGIAVHATLPAERSQIGARFPGTRMQVGEEGTLTVELELRNCNEVRLRNGLDTARLGLSFIDMRESEQKVVQRYILKTERDRRSRENALG
jgi:c-di-GMP-binding flagellar brake protein YcgR